MEPVVIKHLWCCYCIDHLGFDYTSLSLTRKDSIEKCIGTIGPPWKEYKKNGWECIKVDITITPLNS